jgi:hypothetical protein
MIAKIAAAATITHFAHTAGHQNMAKTITAAANKNRQKQSFIIFPPSSSSKIMIKQNPNLLQVTRHRSLNFQVFSHYTWTDLKGAGHQFEPPREKLPFAQSFRCCFERFGDGGFRAASAFPGSDRIQFRRALGAE